MVNLRRGQSLYRQGQTFVQVRLLRTRAERAGQDHPAAPAGRGAGGTGDPRPGGRVLPALAPAGPPPGAPRHGDFAGGGPPGGGVAAELGAVQAGTGGGDAAPPLLHPQRRGADPGPAGRPLPGRGGLPHDRRAHQPPGRPGTGAGGRLPPEAGPGLSAGVPRPGLSGRLCGPHPGPEPQRPGTGAGNLLQLVSGQGGPGPGGAGPEREAEGGHPPAGTGGRRPEAESGCGGTGQVWDFSGRNCQARPAALFGGEVPEGPAAAEEY